MGAEDQAKLDLLLRRQEHLADRLERLHAAQRTSAMRHGWLRHLLRDLETNPRTQFRVHLWGSLYWLANFPLITALFFFAPRLWLQLGIFITLIYSIYANLATDYGAMSAAMAAGGGLPLPEIPVEPHVPVPDAPPEDWEMALDAD